MVCYEGIESCHEEKKRIKARKTEMCAITNNSAINNVAVFFREEDGHGMFVVYPFSKRLALFQGSDMHTI